MPDSVYRLNGRAGSLQREALAGQDGFVAAGVQILEAATELKLLAADGQGAVGAGTGGFDGCGDGIVVDAEEPANAGLFQLQVASGTVVVVDVDFAFLDVPKNPLQHIEKVDADVGGDPARFFLVAFPAGVVPVAAGGEVSQVDIKLMAFRRILYAFFQRDHAGVQAQLQDIVNLSPRFPADFLQGVHIPGIQHQGLFADGIGPLPQGKTNVRIMQIIRRAHTDVIYRRPLPLQLIQMPVEPLKFHKKIRLREIAIHHPYRVTLVVSRQQRIPRSVDRLQVARRYVACGADESKISG